MLVLYLFRVRDRLAAIERYCLHRPAAFVPAQAVVAQHRGQIAVPGPLDQLEGLDPVVRAERDEEMAESVEFKAVVPLLIDYLSSKDARIRGDACHYLSLTRDASHITLIEQLLLDESEEVREIAQDSLDELREQI